MKYMIKSFCVFLFLFILSLHGISSANSSLACDKIKNDQKTLKENPGHHYFKIGLCEFEFIKNKQQFDIAVEAFTKSSKYGYIPSYFALGLLYEERFKNGSVWLGSKGEIGDLQKSIEYYKKAADNQSGRAEYSLGKIYLHEANLPEKYRSCNESDDIVDVSQILPNIDSAVYWLELAAKHGYPVAQSTLSDLYLLGIGVPQDFVMAYVWKNLSVASQSRYNRMMQDKWSRNYVNSQRLISERQYNNLTTMQKNASQTLLKEYSKLYFKPPTELDESFQEVQNYICKFLIKIEVINFRKLN